MGFRNVVSDASTNMPRLRKQYELWNAPGATVVEKLDRIVAAGFGGVDATVTNEGEADELGGMLRDRGLAAGYSVTVSEGDDLLVPIDLAHRMRADYLSVRVNGQLKASPEIAEILEDMFDLANDAGLPLFIETRRGTVTQDLRRTVKVVDRFKKVRFTGDFSHYAAAGLLTGGWSEDVWEHFRPIAVRCGHWVGQGGEQGTELGVGTGDAAQQYKRLWVMGMSGWLRKSHPGDVLPFTCPGEISGAAQVVKRVAEEAWAEAELATRHVEEPHGATADGQQDLTEAVAG
jgi:hypothetical protein